MLGITWTCAEILSISRATRAELKRAYKALGRELGLPIGPIVPADYLLRFSSALDLPRSIRKRAGELLDAAVDRVLIGGHNPVSVVAAHLYAAVKEHDAGITQKRTADDADVSPPTIRVTDQTLGEAGLTR